MWQVATRLPVSARAADNILRRICKTGTVAVEEESTNFRKVMLPRGVFSTRIYSIKVRYTFTPSGLNGCVAGQKPLWGESTQQKGLN